jgi:hypothetical protein
VLVRSEHSVNLAARKVVQKSWAIKLNKGCTVVADGDKLFAFVRSRSSQTEAGRVVANAKVKSVNISDVCSNQPINWRELRNFSMDNPAFFVAAKGRWFALNKSCLFYSSQSFSAFAFVTSQQCQWSHGQRDDIMSVTVLDERIYIIFEYGNFFYSSCADVRSTLAVLASPPEPLAHIVAWKTKIAGLGKNGRKLYVFDPDKNSWSLKCNIEPSCESDSEGWVFCLSTVAVIN